MATLTDKPRHAPLRQRTQRQRYAQRRLTAVLAISLAIVAALVLWLALSDGVAEPPPATGAAALVPADALLYVHLSTDPTRPAVKRAGALERRLPTAGLLGAALTARLDALLTGSSGAGSVVFASDVRPWLGKEAAFAVLDTPGDSAGSLIVLGVRRRALAAEFLATHGAAPGGSYDGVPLLDQGSGTVLAFVRHYLVLGQNASVQAAIDASAGRAPSLQHDPAYRSAAAGEPAGRVLDAYVSAGGLRRLVAPRGGMLGALAMLLDQPALTGVTLSISAQGTGAAIRIHSALDPAIVGKSGPPPPEFTPSLAGVMPAGSTLLLEVSGLWRSAPRVLQAASTVGIGSSIAPLLHRLGAALAAEGVDLGQLRSIFSGETAVALSPPSAGHGPALVIVARTQHEAAARQLLAGLEAPVAQLFPAPSSGPGTVTEFSNIPVAGVTVHQLALGPGLQVDYGVFHGLVVLSTSLQAIAGVAQHANSLGGSSAYQTALGGQPDRVRSLLFADFSQLLTLGEQMGLTRGARLTALEPDLQRIRAVGLASSGGESDTTAELFLQIP